MPFRFDSGLYHPDDFKTPIKPISCRNHPIRVRSSKEQLDEAPAQDTLSADPHLSLVANLFEQEEKNQVGEQSTSQVAQPSGAGNNVKENKPPSGNLPMQPLVPIPMLIPPPSARLPMQSPVTIPMLVPTPIVNLPVLSPVPSRNISQPPSATLPMQTQAQTNAQPQMVVINPASTDWNEMR